jgi:lipid A 3-O-deacylase
MGQRRIARIVALALLAAFSGAAPAAAQPYLLGFVDEVRSGFFLHDALRDSDESHSVDLALELLVAPLWRVESGSAFVDFLANPRPMLGGFLNTDGHADHAYAGLDWRYEHAGGFFLDLTFGAAIHSGRLEQDRFVRRRQNSLGTRWLFRESLDLGWRVGERHYLSLGYAHMSNAGLDDDNDGMDFVGLRYGYRFGPQG